MQFNNCQYLNINNNSNNIIIVAEFGNGFTKMSSQHVDAWSAEHKLNSKNFPWVSKLTLTWTRLEGSHAVSNALFAVQAESNPVTERSRDVGVAKRHHLQHLFDPRLQVSQQLLYGLAHLCLGAHAQQRCASLPDINVYILREARSALVMTAALLVLKEKI